MLHQPRGQAARGQASDIAIRAREVLQNRNIALEIMAEATGVPYETLARDTDRCKYMDAQQALEYGIVDKVITKSNLAEVSLTLTGPEPSEPPGRGEQVTSATCMALTAICVHASHLVLCVHASHLGLCARASHQVSNFDDMSSLARGIG